MGISKMVYYRYITSVSRGKGALQCSLSVWLACPCRSPVYDFNSVIDDADHPEYQVDLHTYTPASKPYEIK